MNRACGFLRRLRARTTRKPLRLLRGRGIEIGAHEIPLPGIRPIYVDRFTVFARKRCTVDVVSDAERLPFADNALDYVATSHVLEHLANPVCALIEWYRVVKPGGWIYLVVPDRRYTFDQPRAITPIEHMLEDFDRGTDASDLTHLEDYAMKRDLTRFAPGVEPADWPPIRRQLLSDLHATVAEGKLVNVHYHVFEPPILTGLLERLRTYPGAELDWDLVRVRQRYPPGRGDGTLALLEVRKRR